MNLGIIYKHLIVYVGVFSVFSLVGCNAISLNLVPTTTPTLTYTPTNLPTETPTKTPTITPTTTATPISQRLSKYEPTALKDIIENFSGEVSGFDAGVTVYFDEDYQVRVIYTGKYRPISNCAINIWDTFRGMRGLVGLSDLYKNEALFKEDEAEYWIPVQEQLIPFFKKEVAENQEVNLYISWLGMYHQDSCHMEWIFFDVDFKVP